ncbi:hypothetical protein ACVI1J_009117 [Bradyrhizobium diazoefficiens]
MTDDRPFRVLSLDGGGMRGTYTATYLDRVATAFARRRKLDSLDIGKGFDLIVGTSTGAIIGCALAVGKPLSEVVALYRKHGPKIFSKKLPSSLVGVTPDLLLRKRALEAGEAELLGALVDTIGEETMAEVYERRDIALAFSAVEMSQHRAWVFKTPHFAATNHRDDNYRLADVCLASSAAPLYRSLAAIDQPDGGDGNRFNVFADGGLWANNPVLLGLIEALDVAEAGREIQIFSLGTCPVPQGEQIPRGDRHRGLPEWKFGGNAASLSVDAQEFAFDHMARKLTKHVNRKCSILRFPHDKVPATLVPYLSLDDTREEAMNALITQARTDADMTNSKCAYRDTDPEAELICSLFETTPPLEEPPAARRSRDIEAAAASLSR